MLALVLAAGASAQAASVSSNWAGYVAAPGSRPGPGFSSVSGTWTVPSAVCTKGHESYSAVWVGLGGASENARGLEQLGTDADCTKAGRPVYSSWFELLPAEAVGVHLTVQPGARLTASVTVSGSHATLRLRNLSSGKRFSITRRVPRIDVSSAEWIVEAPSICVGSSPCKAVPLTDFSEVAFSAANAAIAGHTGPISDPAWTATALELRQGSTHRPPRSTAALGGAPSSSLIVASPTSTTGVDGAFAVRWQEQAVQGERSTPPSLPASSWARPARRRAMTMRSRGPL
jgi:hypothetical protein